MTNLNGFYLDQYALNFLAQLMLVMAVLLYFFRIRNKAQETWPVRLVFIAFAGVIGFNLLEATAVWSRHFQFAHFRYIFLYLTLFAALQSAYRFPFIEEDPFAKQRQRELPVVSILVLTALLGVIFWSIYQSQQLKPDGMLQPIDRFFNWGIVLCILGTILTTFRRLYAMANRSSPRRWGWRHLPVSWQRPVQAMYEVVGVILFAFLISLAMTLSSVGLLPNWLQEIVPTVGVIILLALLSATFLTATLGTTTFMVRLIGPVLLVIIVTLGLAGIVIAQRYYETIQVRPAVIEAQTIRFEPRASGVYGVDVAPLQLDRDWGIETAAGEITNLPFDFPFFGREWSGIGLNEAGVVVFGSRLNALFTYNYQPGLAVYQEQETRSWRTFVKVESSKATVTWQGAASESEIIQAVLYGDGRFDFNYSGLDGSNLKRIGFQSGSGGTDFTLFEPNQLQTGMVIPGDGLLTDYEILHHQALHPLMVPLAYLIIVASLLSIFGFPWLLRAILVTPLNALVKGVQTVEAGDLDVQVPIHNNDELGLVTKAFNRMVETIQESEKHLEAKVEERTQALAESERRLGALEERERIGRELHDDLGQVMSYVHLQVDAALTRLRRDEHFQVEQILSDVERVSQEAHDNIRQFILGIRTDKKRERQVTFWQALDEYLVLVSNRYELEIELTGLVELEKELQLAPAVETQLLRIIQEGITNVQKHAEATLVQVVLTRDGERLRMLLKDNGRGFIPQNGLPVKEGHFGLQIMRERAESVNGRFDIISAPGKGAQIQVEVPCMFEIHQPDHNEQQIPWRVLLVDDHALFREGLANMLRPHGLQIVGVAENGREGEQLAAKLQPDLILMDIHMPEQDGLETTRRIKEQFPAIKVVMLTMGVEESLLLNALSNGASGYLLKSLPAPQFLTLLNEVMAGKTIVSPDLASQVLKAIAQNESQTADNRNKAAVEERLTERQQEVLGYLGRGMNNRQIAEQLFISENTVKYHIRQIMERLELQTRHELIRYELDSQG